MCFQSVASSLGGFASGAWLAVSWIPSLLCVPPHICTPRRAQELSWWQHAEQCSRALERSLRRVTPFLLPHSAAQSKSQDQPRFKERGSRFHFSKGGELQNHLTKGPGCRELGRIAALFAVYPRASSLICISPLLYGSSLHSRAPLCCLPSVQVQHKPYGNMHCFYLQSSPSYFYHLSRCLHQFQMQKKS